MKKTQVFKHLAINSNMVVKNSNMVGRHVWGPCGETWSKKELLKKRTVCVPRLIQKSRRMLETRLETRLETIEKRWKPGTEVFIWEADYWLHCLQCCPSSVISIIIEILSITLRYIKWQPEPRESSPHTHCTHPAKANTQVSCQGAPWFKGPFRIKSSEWGIWKILWKLGIGR